MPEPAAGASLADKVAALSSPACYPVPVRSVQAIETHMSWVFLTEDHAWKLKKPVCYDHLDFRSAAARHFYCLEELRLNRRLAPQVYLDVLPLAREAGGALRIGGQGPAVDWVVQMRRLAAGQLLDALLVRGAATEAQVRGVAQRLAAFHRAQPAAPLDARGFRALLLRQVEEHERGLCQPGFGLPAQRVHALCDGLRGFAREHAPWLALRVAQGRVVEGHGDLRPEHVWLGEPPAIIDALEFSVELRLLDGLDEAGFLALECERLRAPALAAALLDAYRVAAADPAPAALLHFYQALRACGRARLAIAHLAEERYRASPQWRRRALRYLALSGRHLRAARLTPPEVR